MGFFSRLFEGMKKTKKSFSEKLKYIFTGNDIDEIGKAIIKQQIADKVDVDIDVVKKVVAVQLFILIFSAISSVSPLIDATIEHSRKGMNKIGYNLSKLFGSIHTFNLSNSEMTFSLTPLRPA